MGMSTVYVVVWSQLRNQSEKDSSKQAQAFWGKVLSRSAEDVRDLLEGIALKFKGNDSLIWKNSFKLSPWFEENDSSDLNCAGSKQVDEGNLVNVIKQALEKLLGHPISATLMAADFLLWELDRPENKAADERKISNIYEVSPKWTNRRSDRVVTQTAR